MDSAATAEFSDFAHTRWPRRVSRADDPDAYLRKILLNAYRSGRRKRRISEDLRRTAPEVAVADPAGHHDDQAAVLAALAELPPKQREVVLLRFWLDLTEVQTAMTLGCSVGNVKSQTARALAKLRVSAELAGWRTR